MQIGVVISDDKLRATCSVSEDKDAEKQVVVTAEEIYELLNEKQVTFGIKQEAIQKIEGKSEKATEIIVAEGKQPSTGKSAEIHVGKKPKPLEEVIPSQNENGDMNYIAPRKGWYVLVKKGDELAIKTPAKQGKPGTDVFGKEIPGIWGKDFFLSDIWGINTKIDSNFLRAAIDGFVIPKEGKLNVEPVLVIDNHIGPATGSIEIPNSYDVGVSITKDIKTGYWVKANKITVGGCIEDSEIEARDLTVNQGIVGTGDKPISAINIAAGYINGPRQVFAEALCVTREIGNGAEIHASQVKANTIQGSSVTASEAIWTDYMNGYNKIDVGIDYKSKEILKLCTKELRAMEEPFERIKLEWRNMEKRMKYLVDLGKKNPRHPLLAKELPVIKAVKERYDYYKKKMKRLQIDREEAEKNMYPFKKPFVLIRNGFKKDSSSESVIGPDSTINIGIKQVKIQEPSPGGVLTISNERCVFVRKYNIKELKTRLNRIEW